MSNRIQLKKSSVAAKVPLLSDLSAAELAFNTTDNALFISDGSAVHQINHVDYLTTTTDKHFVSDAQVSAWDALASATVTGNVKIGSNINVDGSGVISLFTADSTHTGVLSSTDWSTFNGKQDNLGYSPVDKAGDTMTGALTLPGAPTLANQAATKQYVDDGLSLKLNLTGGTLTGSLTLSADPSGNLEATTKQYVDSQVSAVSGKYAAPVQDFATLTALTSYEDKQIRLVEDAGALFRFDAQSTDVAAANNVLVPDGITAPDPGRWIKVQAATQSHNLLTGLQGGAANDYLHLTTSEKNSYDDHITDATLHITSAQNTWIDAINASSTEVNYLIGVTSAVQTQIDSKQATVTGAATTLLSANLDPNLVLISDTNGKVAQSTITTSQLTYLNSITGNVQTQIDGKVAKAGDTMTGLLVLSGDPTSALNPVTKQYLESYTVDGGSY